MCLIVFAWEMHPKYRLVMAANRDETYQRRTARAGFWAENPDILAGKDLQGGGTWLGIHRNGKFTAITNYRDPRKVNPQAITRGKITRDYLHYPHGPITFLKHLEKEADAYNGFNLLVGNAEGLFYFSNIGKKIEWLKSGIYGLSNALLDTPWPKVKYVKDQLSLQLSTPALNFVEVFQMMQNESPAQDFELPNTGVPLRLEKSLSPAFIKIQGYGTVSTTVTTLDYQGNWQFQEQVHVPVKSAHVSPLYTFT
jgi:uncharacterized protein with NRDE domain